MISSYRTNPSITKHHPTPTTRPLSPNELSFIYFSILDTKMIQMAILFGLQSV